MLCILLVKDRQLYQIHLIKKLTVAEEKRVHVDMNT